MMCLGSGGQEGSLTVPLSSASLSPCPGFDITPNYVDSSPTGIVVSPWCSCRGSGNMEEECEKFLKDFTENPCLRESTCIRPVRSRPAPPVPGDLELCWVLPASPCGGWWSLWGFSRRVCRLWGLHSCRCFLELSGGPWRPQPLSH